MLALTRQNLPQVRKDAGDDNLSATAPTSCPRRGQGPRDHLRVGLRGRDRARGPEAPEEQSFAVRVVGALARPLLAQPEKVRARIIGDAPVKVAVEAAVRFGWDAVIGPTESSSA